MPKSTKLINFDDQTNQILESLGPREMSPFVRKAVVFYSQNKDHILEKESKPIENQVLEL